MARLEIDFLNQFPMEKPEVSSLKVFDLFLIYFDLVFPVSLLYSELRRTELLLEPFLGRRNGVSDMGSIILSC